MIAICWASGEIEFAADETSVPTGAIAFADSKRLGLSDAEFQEDVTVKARLAYDGKTALVPGIPEAECQVSAREALDRWVAWAFPEAREAS